MMARVCCLILLLLLAARSSSASTLNIGVAFALDISESIQTEEILAAETDFVRKFWTFLTDGNRIDLSQINLELVFFPFNEDVDYGMQVVYDATKIAAGSDMPATLEQELRDIATANLTGMTNIPAVFANIISNLRFESLSTYPENRHVFVFILSDFITSLDGYQLRTSLTEAATDRIIAVAVALDKVRDDDVMRMFSDEGHEVVDLAGEVTGNTFFELFRPVLNSIAGSSGSREEGGSEEESGSEEEKQGKQKQ